MTETKTEQRYTIKFCTHLGKLALEMLRMMKEVYKEEFYLHETAIFCCHKAFSEGCESAALIPHGEWLSIACTEINVNTVATIVRDDRHLSCQTFTRHVNMLKSSIYKILIEIVKMRHVCSTLVLHMLTHEQMN